MNKKANLNKVALEATIKELNCLNPDFIVMVVSAYSGWVIKMKYPYWTERVKADQWDYRLLNIDLFKIVQCYRKHQADSYQNSSPISSKKSQS